MVVTKTTKLLLGLLCIVAGIALEGLATTLGGTHSSPDPSNVNVSHTFVIGVSMMLKCISVLLLLWHQSSAQVTTTAKLSFGGAMLLGLLWRLASSPTWIARNEIEYLPSLNHLLLILLWTVLVFRVAQLPFGAMKSKTESKRRRSSIEEAELPILIQVV